MRENVLWFLRRGLEDAVAMQRGMVERRIERAREKEKSVLYKASGGAGRSRGLSSAGPGSGPNQTAGGGVQLDGDGHLYDRPQSTMDDEEVKAIEAELSPEQLQLFAEENDSMVKYYEDTLSKVQYVSHRPCKMEATRTNGIHNPQERREVPPRDLLPPADPRLAPLHPGGLHQPIGNRRDDHADQHRAGKQGAEARDGAAGCRAGRVLGDCRAVHVVGYLGFGFLVHVPLYTLIDLLIRRGDILVLFYC